MQQFLPLWRQVFLYTCLLMCSLGAAGQISLPLFNIAYTQNFDSLASTGTSSVLPQGWALAETGTNANTTYTAGAGTGNAGDTYSFGLAGSSDRSLGGLLSGSVTPTIGAGFTNTTGSTITSLTIAYTGEQWRIGATSRTQPDRLDFQYSLNATSLTTGGWVDVDSLDFNAPVTSATTPGGLNGNLPANQRPMTYTLTNLSIPSGATFWIRWTDFNVSGADDGLAVDAFSITPHGTGTTPTPVLTVSPPALSFGLVGINTIRTLPFSFSGTNLTGNVTVSVSGSPAFQLSKDSLSGYDTVLTFTAAQAGMTPKVYVQFRPATAGTFAAQVALHSEGATPKSVALSGAVANPFEQDFNTCATTLPGGWTQYSTTGPQVWGCTTFGRSGNGVQINGFSGGAVANSDWLISPSLNLTGFDFPLLYFWSRTRFVGPSLKLLVSTNYTGTGDPALATWTELNGQFPVSNSDVWKESTVNLIDFRQANVYVAFVYASSPETGAARWTIDDFTIRNSLTPPPPVLTTSITPLTDLYVESAGAHVPSTVKFIQFSVANATTTTTVSVPAPFQLSKDGVTFTSALSYTPDEASVTDTVFIRALPATEGAFTGSIRFMSGSLNTTEGFLSASSISKNKTFDIVTLNVEWFGHPGNGPSNNGLQAQNLKTLIQHLDADVFAFQEISDIQLFADSIASKMPGYAYVVSPAVSNAGDNDPFAQRVMFFYKTATVTKLGAKVLLQGVNVNTLTDYPDPDRTRFWASGRLPFLLDAEVSINGVTKRMGIINIHARANSGTDALLRYQMRAYDVKVLKDTLDAQYANLPFVLTGDYNDDVDSTVASISSPLISSYQPYSLDTVRYHIATRVLSNAGLRSYISEANVIDHITFSNELFDAHLEGSTRIEYALTYISNYQNTTSDHLPVLTRFQFTNPVVVAQGLKGEFYTQFGYGVSAAQAAIATASPAFRFTARKLDYPATTTSSTAAWATWLGADGMGAPSEGIETSTLKLKGYIRIKAEYDLQPADSSIEVEFALASQGFTALTINANPVLRDESNWAFNTTSTRVSFPTAGYYPIEILHATGYDASGLELYSSIGSNDNPGNGAGLATSLIPQSVLFQEIPSDTPSLTTPANLAVRDYTPTSISLFWEASLGEVAAYEVYKDGLLTATTSATHYTVTGLLPDSSYVFQVRAKDGAGNVSAFSTPLIARTAASGQGLKGEFYTQFGYGVSAAQAAIATASPAFRFTARKLDYPATTTSNTASWNAWLGSDGTAAPSEGIETSTLKLKGYIRIKAEYDLQPADSSIEVEFALASQGFTALTINSNSVLRDESNWAFNTTSARVSFPAAGYYPIEILHATGYDASGLELYSSIGSNDNPGNGAGLATSLIPQRVLFQEVPQGSRKATPVGSSTQDIWAVFPNPALQGETLYILPGVFAHKSVQVSIVDMTGKVWVVKKMLLASKGVSFATTALPKGIYLLRVTDGKLVDQRKLVIE